MVSQNLSLRSGLAVAKVPRSTKFMKTAADSSSATFIDGPGGTYLLRPLSRLLEDFDGDFSPALN